MMCSNDSFEKENENLVRSDLELRGTVIRLGLRAQSATLQLAHRIPLVFDDLANATRAAPEAYG